MRKGWENNLKNNETRYKFYILITINARIGKHRRRNEINTKSRSRSSLFTTRGGKKKKSYFTSRLWKEGGSKCSYFSNFSGVVTENPSWKNEYPPPFHSHIKSQTHARIIIGEYYRYHRLQTVIIRTSIRGQYNPCVCRLFASSCKKRHVFSHISTHRKVTDTHDTFYFFKVCILCP